MSHRGGGGGSVPMLLTWGEPDDVAGSDLLDGAARALGSTAAGGDDQCLTQRMRMPGGAGTGFEGDGSAHNTGRFRRSQSKDSTQTAWPLGIVLRRLRV